jgi:hypothetical protein
MDSIPAAEYRGLERRVFELEKQMNALTLTANLTAARVEGLVSTMDSRHKAFERGQDLILERLKPLTLLGDQQLHQRLTDLEMVKHKAAGALLLMQILGVTGIIGGIIGIARMVSQ